VDSPAVTFTGVVLAGGASTRMGADKALVEVGGRALVTVAAEALADGGATRVVVVGGDAPAFAALGLDTLADGHPGDGPLGGIITALRAATDPVVMVLACDMPMVDGPTVGAIVAALAARPDAYAAAPAVDGRLQILTAAYRIGVLPLLEQAFVAGERAPRRALADVEVVTVTGLDPDRLTDVDRPEDLSRYARPEHIPGPTPGHIAEHTTGSNRPESPG
jgi:molybdopterin-guanine dinucleotide biosynthesis protein A